MMTEKVILVQKLMDKDNLWADAYQYMDLPVVALEINHGDWKHEHWRADYLVSTIGGAKISEKVTEEDGSDCYSSIHYYVFN